MMFLLRQFEVRCEYTDGSGDIAVLMIDGDVNRVTQFACYLYQLLQRSAYMAGHEDALTRPEQYPERLALPQELCPNGEDIVVTGFMEPE